MAQTAQVDQNPDRQSKPMLRRERLRISNACQVCRSRKVKCDGSRPACSRCHQRGEVCAYNRDSLAAGHGRGKRKAAAGGTQARRPCDDDEFNSYHSNSLEERSSALELLGPEHVIEEQDGDLDTNRTYFTPHCRFDGKIKEVVAANDQKAGLTAPAISNLVPFVDAPLFGELDLDSLTRSRDFLAHLPPRPHANYLVSIYWQHIDSVEPLLDRKRFLHDYEASYTRSWDVLLTDHEIWLSILNIVFALAVQRQETIPVQERDAEATLYFQRAWVLLRPEKFLWKPGSVQVVQCLMLMNRYLHCTSHQHKTWMTGGLALRISQNMTCQPPDMSSSPDSDTERETRQKVWASCVALDKCVTWSLGRISGPSTIPLPDITTRLSLVCEDEKLRTDLECAVRGRELHEIGNQIQLAQVQTRNRVASKLGLPLLYQQPEYHTVVVQLDTCLNNWETSLPSNWQFDNLRNIVDGCSRAKAFLLHARLLGTRIFLYRPILARYFSKQIPSANPGLSSRLLRECAAMCVETAQRIVTMILDSLEPNEAIGPLPWWYRVYYLHIAGTTFLAAMLGDLYTESVSQSWNGMLTGLREHVHLSIFIPQCIATFETLSARILETRNPDFKNARDSVLDDDTAGLCFDDIFKDLDLDFHSFLFGIEDIN